MNPVRSYELAGQVHGKEVDIEAGGSGSPVTRPQSTSFALNSAKCPERAVHVFRGHRGNLPYTFLLLFLDHVSTKAARGGTASSATIKVFSPFTDEAVHSLGGISRPNTLRRTFSSSPCKLTFRIPSLHCAIIKLEPPMGFVYTLGPL